MKFILWFRNFRNLENDELLASLGCTRQAEYRKFVEDYKTRLPVWQRYRISDAEIEAVWCSKHPEDRMLADLTVGEARDTVAGS